jgi:hypothetical protein
VVLLFTPLCRHEHACRRFVVRQQLLARAHEGFDVLREAALVHFVGEVRSLHYTERRNDLVVNALPPSSVSGYCTTVQAQGAGRRASFTF